MPLIGTAGHVDHGKSTLIKKMTGRDPDRWAEEKQRGLTIDLGFAWTTLPGGTEVSFVDVPGHERFLKNMLAGIEAVDVALLVVAADEGWMPQSEEHLAVLDLLEVDIGVVALTKTDLVDDELVELASADVRQQLGGSSLESAEVVPVSALTGRGIENLQVSLESLLPRAAVADISRPRLWVDRSFTAAGAGTVVTGTLRDGWIEKGQPVEIYPRGIPARIRGIQSHEEIVPTVPPGRRVALNLAGIDHGAVGRGEMIGLPKQWYSSDRLLAKIRLARYHAELRRRGAYQIHMGSSTRDIQVIGIEGSYAMLALDGALPMAVGDRFVIRDTGRRLVVAGGRVLDPAPGNVRKAIESAPSVDPDAQPDEIATALLEIRGNDLTERLQSHSLGGTALDAVHVGEKVLSRGFIAGLGERAVTLVNEEHQTHPLRNGMPIATLAERLEVDQSVAGIAVDAESRVERLGPDVRAVGFEVAVPPDAETEWSTARHALEKGLDVPTVGELGLDPELLHLKLRDGSLVRVSDDLAYLPDQIDQLAMIIRGLPPEFTVADFRDAAGLSRKYAVPILEWADVEGLTIRRGNLRRLR